MAKVKTRRKKTAVKKAAARAKPKPSKMRKRAVLHARARPKPKPRRMQKRAVLPTKARKETFEFPLPLSEPIPEPPPIPRHEPLALPPVPVSPRLEGKRRMPHAANAVLASLLLTLAFAAIFIFILGIEPLFSLGIGVAIFFGFAILIFNILETGGTQGQPAR